jgi:hypothetical protein
MTYSVAKITTQDGVFFTARSDNRIPKEVVADGIAGYKAGNRSPIYESLNQWENCLVENIKTGLTETEAKELKKAYIVVTRSQGYNVLNAEK